MPCATQVDAAPTSTVAALYFVAGRSSGMMPRLCDGLGCCHARTKTAHGREGGECRTTTEKAATRDVIYERANLFPVQTLPKLTHLDLPPSVVGPQSQQNAVTVAITRERHDFEAFAWPKVGETSIGRTALIPLRSGL